MKTDTFLIEVYNLIGQKLDYLQAAEFGDGIEDKKLTRKDKERQNLLDFIQQILFRSADIRDKAFVDSEGEYATIYPIVSDPFADYVFDKIIGKKWLSTSEKFGDVVRRRKWYEISKKPISKASASAYKMKFEAGTLSEETQTEILKNLGYSCFERVWK